MTNLTEFAQKIHEDNKAKGFYDEELSIVDKLGLDAALFTDAEKDFIRGALIMQKLTLLHTEVSEAAEGVRKPKTMMLPDDFDIEAFYKAEYSSEELYAAAYKALVKDKFQAEIAGTMIRAFDLAGRLNIDIHYYILAELRFNRTRPYKHAKTC